MMNWQIALAVAVVATAAMAQGPVYKCSENGKTSYSHVPCLNATVVDTTPTQGLDKSTGKSMKGEDVKAEIRRQQKSESFYKPLFGETAEETNRRHRRAKFTPEDRAACYKLDPLMQSEKGERLLEVRMQYYKLNC